ncbi:MAG: FadR family transcriptional regulator [Thermoleophilia bacterium]|nr:FadR family transcriptional regulator [Thermoleophilia bacterium]
MSREVRNNGAGGVNWSNVRNATTQVGDGLANTLEKMILDGSLAHGERLPSERELAVNLGCSRTSLRDALRDLQLKGLIERRPGRGTIVVDPQERNFESVLLEKLDGEQRQILEIMDLRSVIEPSIAARAARRATKQDINDLRQILADMASGDLDSAADFDFAFHSRIAQTTHNPILVQLIKDASKWIDKTRRQALFSERRKARSLAAHHEILEAIEGHDDVAAFEAMSRHIEAVNGLLETED